MTDSKFVLTAIQKKGWRLLNQILSRTDTLRWVYINFVPSPPMIYGSVLHFVETLALVIGISFEKFKRKDVFF